MEALMRSILFAANERKTTSFRHIHLQLDNCNSNKCDTLITACALLIYLGVAKKIKVNFLEVGHTHEDIDALIGSVVTKLRLMDLPTLEARCEAIMNALRKHDAEVKAVDEVFGMTDYEQGLDAFNVSMTGLMKIKEFRIAANAEGVPIFLYKSNSTVDGWHPRPFERVEDFDELAKVFAHEDERQGDPVRLVSCYPGSSSSADKSRRLHWFYEVKYAGGATRTWPLKCTGIPIKFEETAVDETEVITVLDTVRKLPRQDFRGDLCSKSKRNGIFKNIQCILQARSRVECIPTWHAFFESLAEKIGVTAHRPVLLDLFEKVGGQVQLPIEYSQSTALYESDLVPPIRVRGVTEINTPAEIQRFLELRATNANLLRLKGVVSDIYMYVFAHNESLSFLFREKNKEKGYK